jgi:hypothetical protein
MQHTCRVAPCNRGRTCLRLSSVNFLPSNAAPVAQYKRLGSVGLFSTSTVRADGFSPNLTTTAASQRVPESAPAASTAHWLDGAARREKTNAVVATMAMRTSKRVLHRATMVSCFHPPCGSKRDMSACPRASCDASRLWRWRVKTCARFQNGTRTRREALRSGGHPRTTAHRWLRPRRSGPRRRSSSRLCGRTRARFHRARAWW